MNLTTKQPKNDRVPQELGPLNRNLHCFSRRSKGGVPVGVFFFVGQKFAYSFSSRAEKMPPEKYDYINYSANLKNMFKANEQLPRCTTQKLEEMTLSYWIKSRTIKGFISWHGMMDYKMT